MVPAANGLSLLGGGGARRADLGGADRRGLRGLRFARSCDGSAWRAAARAAAVAARACVRARARFAAPPRPLAHRQCAQGAVEGWMWKKGKGIVANYKRRFFKLQVRATAAGRAVGLPHVRVCAGGGAHRFTGRARGRAPTSHTSRRPTAISARV